MCPDYKGYLIPGILIALFLAGDVQGEDLTSLEDVSGKGPAPSVSSMDSHDATEKTHKDIKPPPLQIDFRLAGIALHGGEPVLAVIEDETTGRQGVYGLGDTLKGNTVIKIIKGSVELEKDGRMQVLRLTKGSSIETDSTEENQTEEPLSTSVSADFQLLKPIVRKPGPPPEPSLVESEAIEELPPGGDAVIELTDIEAREGPPSFGLSTDLPPFEPLVSETGPPEPDYPVMDLPPFEPITNITGPQVDPRVNYEELPEFTPFVSESGPPGG
jgi:hypothetical protein